MRSMTETNKNSQVKTTLGSVKLSFSIAGQLFHCAFTTHASLYYSWAQIDKHLLSVILFLNILRHSLELSCMVEEVMEKVS